MARPPIIEAAPAKINLYLHVTGKREDGYHLLDSLAVFTPDIADRIHIVESDAFSFSIDGPFAATIKQEDMEHNLAARAARLYASVTGQGSQVSIHLEKNIPAGAGLGGGSADAAAVIRAMERLSGLDLPSRTQTLLRLGADVPVCYHTQACRFEGVGEHISAVPPLPALSMLIVWPACHSSTKDVFMNRNSAYSPATEIPKSFDGAQQFISFLKGTTNDLFEAAASLNPAIATAADLMERQDGCLISRMSGSGSAVFGLFGDRESCALACQAVQAAQPTWWVRMTNLA